MLEAILCFSLIFIFLSIVIFNNRHWKYQLEMEHDNQKRIQKRHNDEHGESSESVKIGEIVLTPKYSLHWIDDSDSLSRAVEKKTKELNIDAIERSTGRCFDRK